MRTCAACGAFRLETPILGQTASAGSPKASWKWAGSSSARTVAAGAALAEHQAPTSTHPGLWAAQDSARHATLSWEHLFLRVVPRPD